MKKLILALTLAFCATEARAAQNTLTWEDRSDNEAWFVIERKVEPCTGTGPFSILISSIPANSTSFVDTTVIEGVTYCYRVAAANVDGMSNWSNEASRRVPLSKPVAPGALTVGP